MWNRIVAAICIFVALAWFAFFVAAGYEGWCKQKGSDAALSQGGGA